MFLNKNKYYLLALAALLLVGACSPFQKVYKSDDVAAKYRFADSLYQVGKYRKALKLMEEIVPAYRGKPQAERLMFFTLIPITNWEIFICPDISLSVLYDLTQTVIVYKRRLTKELKVITSCLRGTP